MNEETGITQNLSESINFVMHSLLEWKEVPIDVLLLAIYRLQLYFLKEIKHGKAGIGRYALRAKQRKYATTMQEIPDLTVCPSENIIESIKNKTFSTEPNDGKMDTPLSRAEEIIKSANLCFHRSWERLQSWASVAYLGGYVFIQPNTVLVVSKPPAITT